MVRSFLALMCLALTALPLAALDLQAMTDEERANFRAEVRAYLLENPDVIMEAIGILEERRAAEAANMELAMLRQNADAIFNDGYSYVAGNPDGDVTVVEFLDYRCGFCKRAHPEVEALLAGDDNIRLIVKEFPILGEQSVLASQYAIAAKLVEGDAAYKSVHDILIGHNGGLNEGFLARTSSDLGLDHDAIIMAMGGPEVGRIINENRALGQMLQIQGTPSFIMGETFVRGFVELEQMQAIVADIRADQG